MSIEQKLEVICGNIPELDMGWAKCAKTRFNESFLQGGGLGTLVEPASIVAAINEDLLSGIKSKMLYMVAADHGLLRNFDVSTFGSDFLNEASQAILNNKSAGTITAKASGVKVRLIDAGIKGKIEKHRHYIEIGKRISADITIENAFSRNETLEAIGAGVGLVEVGVRATMDCIAVASLGVGAELSALSLLGAITDLKAEQLLDNTDEKYTQKRTVINKSINRTNKNQNAIDLLATIGGADIAALVGICLSGAFYRRPIVLDGIASLVAGIIACELAPEVRGYLLAAQEGYDNATDRALECLQVPAIIDMGIGEGDGTAASIALNVLDTSMQLLNKLPTCKNVGINKI